MVPLADLALVLLATAPASSAPALKRFLATYHAIFSGGSKAAPEALALASADARRRSAAGTVSLRTKPPGLLDETRDGIDPLTGA